MRPVLHAHLLPSVPLPEAHLLLLSLVGSPNLLLQFEGGIPYMPPKAECSSEVCLSPEGLVLPPDRQPLACNQGSVSVPVGVVSRATLHACRGLPTRPTFWKALSSFFVITYGHPRHGRPHALIRIHVIFFTSTMTTSTSRVSQLTTAASMLANILLPKIFFPIAFIIEIWLSV